jgi:hypothetical protein
MKQNIKDTYESETKEIEILLTRYIKNISKLESKRQLLK